MSRWTKRLDRADVDAHARLGGKGVNLAAMIEAGIDVPGGFCVTTDAFRLFRDVVDGMDGLLNELDALDVDDLCGIRDCAGRIRSAVEAAPIPDSIASSICSTEEQFEDCQRWAVRSSSTLEDLADASFAGQQETYLNVGHGEVLQRVRSCWASLYTDRAVLYRKRHGYDSQTAALAVVVQEMIDADVSGVMFSADPTSGHRHICAVEAIQGLGDALVSGRVDPAQYRVHKRTKEVLQRRINGQNADFRGGDTQVLSDVQLHRLVRLGKRLEEYFGAPQDVEWCLHEDEFWVVQSRPITTLYPVPKPAPDDGGLHLYVSFGHLQVMTEPMTPMGIDTVRRMFIFGRPDPDEPSELVCRAGSRIYIDATPALLRRPTRRILLAILRHVVGVPQMADAVEEYSDRDDFRRRSGRKPARIMRFLTVALPVMLRALWYMWFATSSQVKDKVTARGEGLVEQWRKRLGGAPTSIRRLETIRSVLHGGFEKVVGAGFLSANIAGILSLKLLTSMATRLGFSERVDDLTRGLEGTAAMALERGLTDVADVIGDHHELRRLFASHSPSVALERGRRLDGVEEVYRRWNEFLRKHGHRASGELDIGKPRWRDEPDVPLRALAAMLDTGDAMEQRERRHEMRRRVDRLVDDLERQAGAGIGGYLRGRLVRRLADNIRVYLSMREHPKDVLLQLFDGVRDTLRLVAEELVEAGRLEAVDDVWFLTLDELRKALHDDTCWADVVEARRARQERFERMRPPRVITSDGEVPHGSTQERPDGVLDGFAASSGVVRGVARVVRDPGRQTLNAGEILVAPFTDPAWTPLFVNASALVMEVGGLMTHGSVVAREYGIPAVVAVDRATDEIETGMLLCVDGNVGTVEILDEVSSPNFTTVDASIDRGEAISRHRR